MSRTDVNPARRSACVFCTAINADISRDMPGLGVLNMCVCASMRPGSTVAVCRSMTCAPGGIVTCAGAPTAVMRSPWIRMTWSASSLPALLSKRRPARIAIVRAGAAHCVANSSMPKHGCGPAPRHGVPGPPAWACTTAGAAHKAPATASTATVDRMRFPPKLCAMLRPQGSGMPPSRTRPRQGPSIPSSMRNSSSDTGSSAVARIAAMKPLTVANSQPE